jgi:predicted dinucleotide-binding enzyme
MNIAVLGTGMVGRTLAAALAEKGHSVQMGTRDVRATLARTESGGMGQPSFAQWHAEFPGVQVTALADAAAFGELVFCALSGHGTLSGLQEAGAGLNGKILVDIANPLDFSKGMPPTLTVVNTDSLGEQIQRQFPAARVVKTLNTVTAPLMVNPQAVAGGDHTLFVSGNDAEAKAAVTGYLREWFGWQQIIDLGDITTARGTEMVLALWIRLMVALGTPMFNYKIVR